MFESICLLEHFKLFQSVYTKGQDALTKHISIEFHRVIKIIQEIALFIIKP